MESIEVPAYAPPPPPKRPVRPKITLQIPEFNQTPMTPRGIHFTPRFHTTTPGSHISDPHHPFVHMYHNKASEFMFKQFEGFKDFTMNTAKSGLSAGEKSAFWFYNKLRVWSKRWFTHFFLTLCLVLYSVMGAAIFMALEGPNELKYDKNLTDVRQEMSDRIRDIVVRNKTVFEDPRFDLLKYIENDLLEYESNYTEFMKHLNNNDAKKKTWSFWNSMFYAGTIYTTIGVKLNWSVSIITMYTINSRPLVRVVKVGMNEEGEDKKPNPSTLKIPIIKAETATQTLGQLVTKAPDDTIIETMETDQNMSLRKRRNLSKNRGQAARQREKTPEPSRTPIPHEDTPTSEEEDDRPPGNSREVEAYDAYKEMRRLVQEKENVKDPVYDIDTDEILEARVTAAVERRRRSISPFAVLDKEELCKLERKGSFIDPTNKLLSTNYTLSPKDVDPNRRDSLVLETPPLRINKNTLSPTSSGTASPNDSEFPYPMPATPKKQEPMVYADEKKPEDEKRKLKTPVTKEDEVFTFDEKDTKPALKAAQKQVDPSPGTPGEIVTRVIQVERVPSKKLLSAEKKPTVEVRERVVRTPSRKMSVSQTNVPKQAKPKEEQQKVPPVKPARSKSATRIGNKTSESEMSEDQAYQTTNAAGKRRVAPTPRRFQRNRSPRANRSQSVNRPPAEVVKVIDRTGTGMSQTSKEIIELMAKARARSLSIPKDDPRLPIEYKRQGRELKTPNKTPINLRHSRGISCPKTIQIIPNKEILSGLTSKKISVATEILIKDKEQHSRQSSGYVDASQSELTSSCYSSSPSENEYEFDLSERTAELTRKLNILSQEVDKREANHSIILADKSNGTKPEPIEKSVLRKRSVVAKTAKKDTKTKCVPKETEEKPKPEVEINKQVTKSRIIFIANWQQFKQEHNLEYTQMKLLRNRCICDLFLLVIVCGLGGMMFKTLEGSFENAYKCGSRNVKRDFIESLWRGSHYLREDDWKSMARKKLYEFEDQLHNAHEAGVTSYSGQRSWNFMNSFVYCMTLVTTIGYGHIAPKTTYGRVATIVYAIVGIPLFLIVLADFGKLFTRVIKFFWAFIRRFYYTRSCSKVRRTKNETVQEVMKGLNTFYDVVRRPSQIFNEDDDQPPNFDTDRKPSLPPPLPPKPGQKERDPENDIEPETPAPSVFEIDDEFNLPISVAISILLLYIIVGAVAYNLWESWDFFESFYFVFISMSTIGLGDLVPDHPMFMMASILYLVFGLALTSMCINVVQEKLSDTFKQASAKLGATIGLKVAEEDGSLVPITPTPTEIVPVHKGKNSDKNSLEGKESDTKTDKLS